MDKEQTRLQCLKLAIENAQRVFNDDGVCTHGVDADQVVKDAQKYTDFVTGDNKKDWPVA